MKKTAIYIILFIALVGGGAAAYTYMAQDQNSDSSSSSQSTQAGTEAEPIKAEILKDDPSAFMIDVGLLENSGADTDAEYFAVYISDEKPADCADFRDTGLSYEKPEKHQRRFDLSDHEDVLGAIKNKQCVIIPNVPASKS